MSTGLRKQIISLMVGTRFSSKALPVALLFPLLLASQSCEAPQNPGRGGAPGMPGASNNLSKSATPGASRPTAVQRPGGIQKIDLGANVPTKADPSKVLAKVLGTLDTIEIAGNKIELASLIIGANTNPFLNRLPKPLETAPVSAEAPILPFVDPFDGINLLGIIYNPKQPMALVAEGDNPANIKKTGDLLNNGTIRVVRIGQGDIILQQVGVSKQQRSLALPDIVGYAAREKDGGDSGGEKSHFKNISKLLDPDSDEPAEPKNGPNVTLQEP